MNLRTISLFLQYEKALTIYNTFFRWYHYFLQDFIDELVVEGLLRTVASSLGYLLDETDPYLTQGVLFDVRLELAEPDVIFVPPIDQNLVNNFYDQLVSYVDDIFFQCTLFPRIANHERNLGKKIGKPLSYGNP